MKKKKVLAKGNKVVLFLIQQIIAVIAALCIAIVAVGSMVEVTGGFSQNKVFLNPFEYDMEFEESDIYTIVLERGIRDAVRMSVIKSQLETEGEFDGSKKIDVTAYVNRAEQLSGQYVTANYKLEDLLKWGKYGLEYTGKVFESELEMNDFLADETTYTNYEGTYTTGFHPTQENSHDNSQDEAYTDAAYTDAGGTNIYVYSEAGYETLIGQRWVNEEKEMMETPAEKVIESEENAEGENYQTILSNRYKTVDGKTPQELVSSWDEYYELCNNIAEAANSLYYNYEEYLNYESTYSLENSNLIYCMEMMVDGEKVYFTNAILKDFKEETITEYFNGFKKNIYYNPYDMEYFTNTNVPEKYFLQLTAEYNYAYSENTKIWIAVDDSYPAQDLFAKAEYTYNSFLPYWWQYVIGAICCIVIYILLLVVQSVFTGRKEYEGEEEEESRVLVCATKFEQIPTEIWMLICGIAAGLLVIMAMFTFDMCHAWKPMDNQVIFRIVAVETLIISSGACLIFYSFVRKCKVHNLWKGSFLYYVLKLFYQKVLLKLIEAVKIMYRNMPIVVRSLLPYCIFVIVNIVFVFWFMADRNEFLLLILGAADAAVGWILFRNSVDKKKIVDGIGEIRNGDLNYQVDASKLYGDNRILAEAVNSIGDGIRTAVETSMKDERLKADLITNVSHDIKTPLTSIINYVDLLKREDIQDEKVKNYIQVLDSKSQRLKQLTDDLVEASKISSGNITLHIERINIVELLNQAIGEFSEKFETKDLQMVVTFDGKSMYIDADSRRMWRVIENLFNNIFKYAMAGTRVYVDGREVKEGKNTNFVLTIKNISAQPLNINADELTERFIRGDVSRSTEGSGLGLSIAKNLTEAQNGKFNIHLDGDLFKAVISFPKAEERRD